MPLVGGTKNPVTRAENWFQVKFLDEKDKSSRTETSPVPSYTSRSSKDKLNSCSDSNTSLRAPLPPTMIFV